jgi:hypothetical protein
MKKIMRLLAVVAVSVGLAGTAFAQAGGDAPDLRVKANGFIDSLSKGWTNVNTLVFTNGTTISPADAATIKAGGTATLTPTIISNATLKVYGSNLVVVTGGTVSLPANSITATMIGTANMRAAVSNLFSSVSINGTNFYMLAYP